MRSQNPRLKILLDNLIEAKCEIYERGGFFDPNKLGEKIVKEEKFLDLFIETFPETRQTLEKYLGSPAMKVIVRSLINILYYGGEIKKICDEFYKNYIDGIVAAHNEICRKKNL